jgi:hypothetical protein
VTAPIAVLCEYGLKAMYSFNIYTEKRRAERGERGGIVKERERERKERGRERKRERERERQKKHLSLSLFLSLFSLSLLLPLPPSLPLSLSLSLSALLSPSCSHLSYFIPANLFILTCKTRGKENFDQDYAKTKRHAVHSNIWLRLEGPQRSQA